MSDFIGKQLVGWKALRRDASLCKSAGVPEAWIGAIDGVAAVHRRHIQTQAD
jgi:hypothetical protein